MKGCTGIWKNGRNDGNDKIRPEEKLIVGRIRDRVECMIECRVNNSERRRNALCDNVANVKGRNIRISRNVVSCAPLANAWKAFQNNKDIVYERRNEEKKEFLGEILMGQIGRAHV